MSKKPPHIWAVGSVLDAITRQLPSGWTVRKEDPVRIPEFDEPEPDVAVVRGSRDDYRNRLPGPDEVALLVEVADATLPFDRAQKRTAYARGGIPIYWIVNLIDRHVEVYSAPAGDAYESSDIYGPDEEVPVVIAGVEAGGMKVSDILP
jgi:Uma2 family endonuclease